MPATPGIEVQLSAAIVAVEDTTPMILVRPGDADDPRPSLPYGRFDPAAHRTIEMGLRAWVAEQTGLALGYVEQLYTFGDRGRHRRPSDTGPHVLSIGYLALTRLPAAAPTGASFLPWYGFFPWEDWRDGGSPVLAPLLDELEVFAAAPAAGARPGALRRPERVRLAFATDSVPWDEERALDRYELLYEAGLVAEAAADGREAAMARAALPPAGAAMRFDHRRILATAISRLRGKLKYRPVVFELMPDDFTLTELQQTVEALSGRHLHKQNFRRLVEAARLVEPTGFTTGRSGGRPAQLFRFRREVVEERPAAGFRFGTRG